MQRTSKVELTRNKKSNSCWPTACSSSLVQARMAKNSPCLPSWKGKWLSARGSMMSRTLKNTDGLWHTGRRKDTINVFMAIQFTKQKWIGNFSLFHVYISRFWNRAQPFPEATTTRCNVCEAFMLSRMKTLVLKVEQLVFSSCSDLRARQACWPSRFCDVAEWFCSMKWFCSHTSLCLLESELFNEGA